MKWFLLNKFILYFKIIEQIPLFKLSVNFKPSSKFQIFIFVKYHMVKNIISLFLILFSFLAQSQTLKGLVLGQKKIPLVGVNVYTESGTGLITDEYGTFEIELNAGRNVITFSYIGFESKTITYFLQENELKNISITLNEASKKLDMVVVSAGKFEQRIEETTVSMEVIKPQIIENKNTTNIKTVIDQVPGVNVTDGQANIRGGSGWSYGAGSRVLVMVDDMPIISGDAGQVQWKLIATENINQIEVLKGASSVLYGSSALNGVINIRTKFPTKSDIDRHPQVGYTTFTTHYGVIDLPKRESLIWWDKKKIRHFRGLDFFHAQKMSDINMTIGGNFFNDEGYRKGEIVDRKRFNFSLEKLNTKSNLIYGIKGNFLFQSSGSALIWDSFENGYVPLNDKITTTSGDVFNIDPYIKFSRGKNKHSLNTRYLHLINDNNTKGSDVNDDNKSKVFFSDYKWQRTIADKMLFVTAGTTNEIVLAQSKIFQGKNTRNNHSLYSQFDLKFNKLNLSLGGRYEYFSLNSEEGHEVNGDTLYHFAEAKPVFRTGINYQIAEGTFLRSSWGQGYRFPSMAELFVTTRVSDIEIFPNPSLKSESGWSSEIGLKQILKFKDLIALIDVAGFIMRYNDMMEFTFGQWAFPEFDENGSSTNFYGLGFKSVNVGKTQISGLEISFSGNAKLNQITELNFMGGYTYINPISLEINKEYAEDIYENPITYSTSSSDATILKYRYKHVTKFDIELKKEKVSLGISMRYNDFMSNIDKIFTEELINEGIPGLVEALIPGINESREKYKNGDLIFDFRIAYLLNNNTRLSFISNNALNREYVSRPADLMAPRTFALQLNVKL